MPQAKRKLFQQGFAVTEIAVTIFLISLLVAVSGGMIKLLGRANQEATHTSSVATVVQSKIEDLRNRPYASIAIGSQDFTNELPSSLPHPRQAQISVSEVRSGLKRIQIAVSFDGSTQTYVTYVSENGIGSSS